MEDERKSFKDAFLSVFGPAINWTNGYLLGFILICSLVLRPYNAEDVLAMPSIFAWSYLIVSFGNIAALIWIFIRLIKQLK